MLCFPAILIIPQDKRKVKIKGHIILKSIKNGQLRRIIMDNARVFTGYNSIFATRLRDKMVENKTTQQVLADYVEVKRQTISQYMDGSIQPNIEKLYKIADFFKVSTDYLLGNNDVESSNIDNIAINKKLGLSDVAIDCLEVYNQNFSNNEITDIINSILENNDFYCLCSNINKAKIKMQEIASKINEKLTIEHYRGENSHSKYLQKFIKETNFEKNFDLQEVINEITKDILNDFEYYEFNKYSIQKELMDFIIEPIINPNKHKKNFEKQNFIKRTV